MRSPRLRDHTEVCVYNPESNSDHTAQLHYILYVIESSIRTCQRSVPLVNECCRDDDLSLDFVIFP